MWVDEGSHPYLVPFVPRTYCVGIQPVRSARARRPSAIHGSRHRCAVSGLLRFVPLRSCYQWLGVILFRISNAVPKELGLKFPVPYLGLYGMNSDGLSIIDSQSS